MIIDFLFFSIFFRECQKYFTTLFEMFVIELLQKKKDILIKMPLNLRRASCHINFTTQMWSGQTSVGPPTPPETNNHRPLGKDLKRTHLLCNRRILLSNIYNASVSLLLYLQLCVNGVCLSMEISTCLPVRITAVNPYLSCRALLLSQASVWLCFLFLFRWDEFMAMNTLL